MRKNRPRFFDNEPESDAFLSIAKRVQDQANFFWDSYQLPMQPAAVKGVAYTVKRKLNISLLELLYYLNQLEYINLQVSPSGKHYIFPYLRTLKKDKLEILTIIQQLERSKK